MEDYIVGYKSWDELQQSAFQKTNIPSTTTTVKPRRSRNEIGNSGDIYVILIEKDANVSFRAGYFQITGRPHLSGVAGSVGEYVAVYFDPPGLYERKNWKHLIDSPYGSQSPSLGLNWNAEVQTLGRVDVFYEFIHSRRYQWRGAASPSVGHRKAKREDVSCREPVSIRNFTLHSTRL